VTGLARPRAGTLAVVGVTLGVAWALKRFYSHASFDELGFLLAPTVRLAEPLAGGVRFALEPHHGYLSRDARFEIVPACASTTARVALVAGSAAAAWVVTVLANATRIALAVRLHEAGVACGPLTPARLHCALGVAVYFAFLLVLFALASRVAEARHDLAT